MKFRQIGLRISDLNRAVAFYSKLLESEVIARFDSPGFAFFDLDGVRLFLDVNAPKSAVYLEGLMYRDWETDRKSTRLNSSHRL